MQTQSIALSLPSLVRERIPEVIHAWACRATRRPQLSAAQLAALFSILICGAAAAGVIDADDRRFTTSNPGYVLLIDGPKVGSGALVGRPDIAVTAAHVFFRRGKPLPIQEIDVLYLHGGAPVASPRYRVAEVLSVGSQDPNSDEPWDDWAVIRLAESIPGSRPLALAAQPAMPPLMVEHIAHWRVDLNKMEDSPLGQMKCQSRSALGTVFASSVETIIHSCDTDPSESGSALVVLNPSPTLFALHTNTMPKAEFHSRLKSGELASTSSELVFEYNYGPLLVGRFLDAVRDGIAKSRVGR